MNVRQSDVPPVDHKEVVPIGRMDDVVSDLRPERGIAKASQHCLGPPRVSPGRHELAQVGASRCVWVNVVAHVLGSGRLRDHGIRGPHLAPVLAPRRFMVRDLHRHVRLAPDAQGLAHRVHHRVRLATNVGGAVQCLRAVPRHETGLPVPRWRSTAPADRPGPTTCRRRPPPWPRQPGAAWIPSSSCVGRRSTKPMAQARMAPCPTSGATCVAFGAGAVSPELAKTVPGPGPPVLQPGQRAHEVRADAVMDRGRRQSAVAGHLGGDALADHALRPPVGEERDVRVIVDIDEAGADNAPRGIQPLCRRGRLEVAECGDPIPGYPDIGRLAGCSCAVHQQAILDHDIEGHKPISRGMRRSRPGRAGNQETTRLGVTVANHSLSSLPHPAGQPGVQEVAQAIPHHVDGENRSR